MKKIITLISLVIIFVACSNPFEVNVSKNHLEELTETEYVTNTIYITNYTVISNSVVQSKASSIGGNITADYYTPDGYINLNYFYIEPGRAITVERRDSAYPSIVRGIMLENSSNANIVTSGKIKIYDPTQVAIGAPVVIKVEWSEWVYSFSSDL